MLADVLAKSMRQGPVVIEPPSHRCFLGQDLQKTFRSSPMMSATVDSATYQGGEEDRASPFLSSQGSSQSSSQTAPVLASSQSSSQTAPDLASSTPLDSSPAAEWDLLAVLQNMDLARPDPAVWAAGGAEWTDFSADSALPLVPSVGLIQPPAGAAKRLPDTAAGLSSRLHVCNLPFRFRHLELARLFSTYGHVIDSEIIFNEKGSKGFGFITLGSAGQAAWAREQLHGAIVEGRRIEVNPATAKAAPRAPTLVQRRHKSVAEEQQLVEAHTRLAEAQLAVLRMQHCIQFPQVQRPTHDHGGQGNKMFRVFGR